MKRRTAFSIIIMAIVGFGSGGVVGFDYGLSKCPEPETVYLEVPVERVVTKMVIKEVEVIKTEVIEVPIIKEVNRWKPYPQHFKEFDSKEHLETWCERQVITVLFGNPDQTIDCDDYAEFFQRRALAQGYLVSTQIVENKTHMLNLTMIGNEIYFIEPQPDKFKVWLVAERD